MAVYKCKMCGGSLEVAEGITVCECEYCGTQQTLPKTDNEQNLNMFNRANHFRQQCEFDKAAEIYEKMAARSEGDAELYWSLVLCRYGIEYVDDPLTKKKIATCHRTQFRSILDDPDYLTALEHADMMQKSVYEREAEYIDNVQKGILEISNKEEPFDVFICYKETDNNGRRTQDSVLAQELYYGLTQEGFKVFFSRITLESKLGTEYEPYIFAALNSSKVMVVVGTKPEYFNAVWVRNEWSRYLMLMQNDKSRTLIPAYKDMDPYDLPDDLSMFQAQDMSKLGFMQDIIRGIKKLIRTEPENEPVKTQPVQQNSTVLSAGKNLENLLKRGFICLEDKKWKEADQFFEQVLDENVEEHRAYIGKLCAELNVSDEEALVTVQRDFTNSDNYRKACRFGGKDVEKRLFEYSQKGLYECAVSILKNAQTEERCIKAHHIFIKLGDYRDSKQKIDECKEKALLIKYNEAMIALNNASDESSCIKASELFEKLGDYKDSKQKIDECKEKSLLIKYNDAMVAFNNASVESNFIKARGLFEKLGDYKDSALKAKRCAKKAEEIRKNNIYIDAKEKFDNCNDVEDIKKIIEQFQSISDYQDSEEQIKRCEAKINEINEELRLEEQRKIRKKRIAAIVCATIILLTAGTFTGIQIKKLIDYNKAVSLLENQKYDDAINAFLDMNDYKDSDNMIKECKYQKAISLYENGNIADSIKLLSELRKYKDLNEIINEVIKKCKNNISAGYDHTIGLKSDGTVIATGRNTYGECDVTNWKDIIAVSAGRYYTIGLKSDGTVIATGRNTYVECDVTNWKDIIAVSAGRYYTIGLKSDGTAIATGRNTYVECDVTNWKDIIAVSAGDKHTIGLKSDGTVMATGRNNYGQCDVSDWKDIIAVSAGDKHTIGLKSDGTVVAAGYNEHGQCDISDWKDVIAVSAGYGRTIGLKSDGTVVATGNNILGQCDVSDWNGIIAVSAGDYHTIGLKTDGTVVAAGYNASGQCKVSDWKDIKIND